MPLEETSGAAAGSNQTGTVSDLPGNDAKEERPETKEAPGVGTDALEQRVKVLPPPESNEPVYVQLKEEREPSGTRSRSSRSGSGGGSHHKYTLRFYLVDTLGGIHHCATGIDVGDSHYEYHNETGFPFLHCFNKTEVRKWADGIIHRSQARVGFHTDVVQDIEPPPGTDAAAVLQTLPTFVSYSEQKETLVDGRHRIRWYLLDTGGHHHLAVTGEEKETRDGHYSYHTESIFDRAAPLEAGNQESVKRWLEAMISHQVPPPSSGTGHIPRSSSRLRAALHATSGTGTSSYGTPYQVPSSHGKKVGSSGIELRSSSRLAHPRVKASTSNHVLSGFTATPMTGYTTRSSGGRGRRGRGRGRGPGRPPRSFSSLTSYSTPAGPGTYDASYLQRKAIGNSIIARRGRGGYRIVDPDRDARELMAAEMRRWANEESKSREALKHETQCYLESDLTPEEVGIVTRCLPILQSPGDLPPPGSDMGSMTMPPTSSASSGDGSRGTHEQKVNLMRLIGALREISHMRASLSLTSHEGLLDAMKELKKSPISEVATLASWTLENWLRSAVMHASVLVEPKYMQNPHEDLDAVLEDREKFDPIVTAITHRTLETPRTGPSPGSGKVLMPRNEGGSGVLGGENALESPYQKQEQENEVNLSRGGGRMQDEEHMKIEEMLDFSGGQGSEEGLDSAHGSRMDTMDYMMTQSEATGATAADISRGMVSMPSGILLEAPSTMPIDDNGPHILNEFEQHLAEEGAEF